MTKRVGEVRVYEIGVHLHSCVIDLRIGEHLCLHMWAPRREVAAGVEYCEGRNEVQVGG